MLISLVKRSVISLLTLISVLLITFLLLHTVPGGPFDQERQLPPEIEANLYQKYGLHQRGDDGFWPWFGKDLAAYGRYLIRGQLGPSLKFRDRDVVQIIAESLGPSIELGLLALVGSLILGVAGALLVIRRPGGPLDHLFLMLTSLKVSLPTFVVAVFLVILFCFELKWLPPALWEGPTSRVLPVVTLMLGPLAYFFQLARKGLVHEMALDYVRTARAKGVPPFKVVMKHAFKNASIPLITILGPMLAYLITGSFIVETIFSIPGLGRHFVLAIIDRDYFLVMGITGCYAALLILLNWLVDVAYLWIDPRIRGTDSL